MAIYPGVRFELAARGMFVGALALACSACGGDKHSRDDSSGGKASGGKASSGGATLRGGAGGATNAAGNAGSAGDVAAGGTLSSGGTLGEGGVGAEAGAGDTGAVPGTGGSPGGGTDSGGAGGLSGSSGGASAGGASAGGTVAAGGMVAMGGVSAGGTQAGGANAGGSFATGGASAGGMASGGAGPGGAGSSGASSGGVNSGGTSGAGSGGTNSGGTSAGGMTGGTNAGGAPARCGDALLVAPEECDDGNTQSLDGCNAECRYEVVDRMTTIAVQGTSAPNYCSPSTNVLGRAFSGTALGEINAQLQQSLSDGALNNLLHFKGLEDLTGESDDAALSIGFLPAAPDLGNGPWPGGTPIDFWFRVPATSVDAERAPLNSLLGSLTTRTLSAGPGLLKLPLAISGAPSTLSISEAHVRASVDAAPAPNVPAPPPPALARGLTVFQSITGSGSGQGICGNVTVESLAHIPVPPSLATGASSACLACNGSRTYTACAGNTVEPGCNSMLDVLVGGCKTLLCFVTVVTPAQPDVPAVENASVRPLSIGSGNAVPSEQSAGNQDAYSSYFKFSANRAHITGLR